MFHPGCETEWHQILDPKRLGLEPERLRVAMRGRTEKPTVLSAELRRTSVPDPEAGSRGVEPVAEHQPTGLLEPQALLVLERGRVRVSSAIAVWCVPSVPV